MKKSKYITISILSLILAIGIVSALGMKFGNKLVITEDGNVGIGTTEPQGRLHLFGGEMTIQNSFYPGVIYSPNGFILRKGINAANYTDLLFLEPSGGVRMGQPDDEYNGIDNTLKGLSVKGISGEAVAIAVGHSKSQSAGLLWRPNLGAVLYTFGNQQPMHYQASKHVFDGGQIKVNEAEPGVGELRVGAAWGYPGIFGESTSKPLVLGSAMGKIYMNSNVGIGTDNPNYKLEVVGSVKATDYYSSDGTIGVTKTCNSNIQVKNGLVTACS